MEAGEVLASRYRVVRRLGAGGMGEVWEAVHVLTTKRVALKFLHPAHSQRADVRARFLREARAAGKVRHPNIVAVHDVLELENGAPMMVMDFLSGETLSQKLHREGPLSVGELARTLRPVVDAMSAAHSLGIVHRDLKPDNLFLDRQGDGTIAVKVLDFGIAKLSALDESQTDALTRTGAMLGTPYYMSPEQAYGEKDLDARSDVWSLGIIVYECLTGAKPTEGDNMGQILKRITLEPIVPLEITVPGTPRPLSDLVQAMLSRVREGRPSLEHVGEVLLAIEGESTIPGTKVYAQPSSTVSAVSLPGGTSPSMSGAGPVHRPWLALGLVAVPFAAFVAALGIWFVQTRDGRAPVSTPSTEVRATGSSSVPSAASSGSQAVPTPTAPASAAIAGSASAVPSAASGAPPRHGATATAKASAPLPEPAKSAAPPPAGSTPSVGKLHEDVPF